MTSISMLWKIRQKACNQAFRPDFQTYVSLALQVCQPNGEVIITNDGATILKQMQLTQPAAKMLVELSKSQVCSHTLKVWKLIGMFK